MANILDTFVIYIGKYITDTFWVFIVTFTTSKGKPSDFDIMGQLM